MNTEVIFIRLLLSIIFSSLIGYEREVNESNAGIKTHILVAIGSTIVALMQVEIMKHVRDLALAHPDVPVNISSDASRLIAQVVSGIGFLGAGTIIVTKRNVTGLTTAASIWTVASIGLAVGMGFYSLAFLGFFSVIFTLFVFRRLIQFSNSYRIIIKYMGGSKTLEKITDILDHFSIDYEITGYRSELFYDYTVHENTFKIKEIEKIEFQDLISRFSTTENIVSIERTNLH